jgi:hypothetical protein
LNIAKSYYVTRKQIEAFDLPEASLIPILTSDDGAPFSLDSTKHFLIDRRKVDRDLHPHLRGEGIDLFDTGSTRKVPPILVMPRGVSRHFCSLNPGNAYSASCVDVYDFSQSVTNEVKLNLWLSLNSTVCWLWREVSGRKNLGGGMLKAEAVDLESLPIYMDFGRFNEIKELFEVLKFRDAFEIMLEIDSPEHRKIDEIVATHLGLSHDENAALVVLLKEKVSERTLKAQRKRGKA